MDKREAREYIGTNHHFNPSMNPGTPPKHSWWQQHQKRPTQPIQIVRQTSQTSEGTASPTASPSTTSPTSFSFPKHEAKPKIFQSFDFAK